MDASGRNGQSAITAYQAERKMRNGKKCTSGTSCNDIVARTTDWTGQVGLIYPSDYGYTSINADCRNWINANTTDKSYCKNDNWLHNNQHYWTLSPAAHCSNSNVAWIVFGIGYVGPTMVTSHAILIMFVHLYI